LVAGCRGWVPCIVWPGGGIEGYCKCSGGECPDSCGDRVASDLTSVCDSNLPIFLKASMV
jgi:hypothetical protein